MKIKLMGSWVIYYKLLCSKGFFPPCVVKELCECSLRATSQGNEEDNISQKCPQSVLRSLIHFWKAFLEMEGFSGGNSGEKLSRGTLAQGDADLGRNYT